MKKRIAAVALAAAATLLFGQDAKKASQGVYTKEQGDSGKALYGAKCASCHGSSLEGGDVPPALAGGTFMANWGNLPISDLFSRIRTGMPPGQEGSLSRNQTADITAYILQFNGYPAGQTALPTQDEVLKGITLDPKN
ncbi:MAG TPA: cytochrome c [Bryobacteraceae bacterium]|nr:cytochrome c [Bryobacteraceae bacterium]